MSVAVAAVEPVCGEFSLEFVEAARSRRREALATCWDVPFEKVLPVRLFGWPRGGHGFPGWWWSATLGDHVGFESWLERDHLMLLDFDPDVVGLAAQPFWLRWHDGVRQQRHAPDFFGRLADGRGLVVDVRADDRIEPADAEAFAATARACGRVGWLFRRVGVPDGVLVANVRWLARYRHPRCAGAGAVVDRLVEVFSQPRPLFDGAAAAVGRVDERVVAAMSTAISEATDASSRTAGFVLWRTEQILAGADPPVVAPSRRTLYRLFARLAHGRQITGSARARRSLAARPDGPFSAVTVAAPGELMQIDSTQFDVLVRLDDGVSGRVELTGSGACSCGGTWRPPGSDGPGGHAIYPS